MSDAVAIDASVALQWLLGTQAEAATATALLSTTAEARLPVLVSPTFHAAVAAELHGRSAGAAASVALTPADAQTALAVLVHYPFQVVQTPGLYTTALKLAQGYRLVSFDHALNAAVAGLAGCELWTADQQLLSTLDGSLPHIRSITGYGAR